MQSYKTLASTAPGIIKKESWYALPSGVQYEGNQHIQAGVGPVWGPKTNVNTSLIIPVRSGIALIGLIILIIFIIW